MLRQELTAEPPVVFFFTISEDRVNRTNPGILDILPIRLPKRLFRSRKKEPILSLDMLVVVRQEIPTGADEVIARNLRTATGIEKQGQCGLRFSRQCRMLCRKIADPRRGVAIP
jgi:hypothetical protein